MQISKGHTTLPKWQRLTTLFKKTSSAKSLAFQATQNSYCKNQSPRHNNDIDNRITSSSVSSSGSPSKPLSSSSSPPIFSSPFTADGNVWGFSRRVYALVDAPNETVESMGICWGLCGSNRMWPKKVPCAGNNQIRNVREEKKKTNKKQTWIAEEKLLPAHQFCFLKQKWHWVYFASLVMSHTEKETPSLNPESLQWISYTSSDLLLPHITSTSAIRLTPFWVQQERLQPGKSHAPQGGGQELLRSDLSSPKPKEYRNCWMGSSYTWGFPRIKNEAGWNTCNTNGKVGQKSYCRLWILFHVYILHIMKWREKTR